MSGAVCMHCGRPIGETEREYCMDCGRRFRQTRTPGTYQKSLSCIRQGKAVLVYEGAVKPMMYRFKYGNRRMYADFLADCACARQGDWILRCGVQAVVPVPMYGPKERRRGYNQAGLFGRALADRLELDFLPHAVRRIRNTRPQKELNGSERENNLKNAFQASDFIVQYNCILLVDDIYTTGSTAEAVAGRLQEAGVRKIYFLAVCIGEGL